VTDPECLAELFVNHSIRKLRLMQQYLEVCVAEVDSSALSQLSGPGQNSISNLIVHLCGNLRQWIGSTLGGLPDIRDRKAEFEEQPAVPKDGLLLLLRNTVDEAVAIISGIDAGKLAQTVKTQDGALSVLEVIYQVVGHFQQHTGQVVFAVKQITGRDLQLYRAPN
jgi:uncharacterized damage-inducible protein DinB